MTIMDLPMAPGAGAGQQEQDLVLEVRDVRVRFPMVRDWRGRVAQSAHALNGIDLRIRRGEAFGIVGESGCGKSTLAQVLMGLLPPTEGEVRRQPRGDGRPANVQIVFQDPQSSLDPRLPAWKVIVEPVVVRGRRAAPGRDSRSGRAALRACAAELAVQVGLRPETLDRYVHEFSGGQRQRIAIARALSSDPDVIVLDEPTSALDISVQAQILNLLQDLRGRHGLTYVLISHNVSVVRHLCDRVAVMYLGQIVEQGTAAAVLETPRHPYTRELLDAVPRLDRPWTDGAPAEPVELPGNRVLPAGCFFRERCPWARQGCERPQPLLCDADAPQHLFRCHVAQK
ncbi:ABC transporter ATP-binding protein [uncultured Castellaniella sp.]|uniref:ABC transporter ATP-binding protein n=1 Tax=uncultured Castellaniella sp. TaxID=647907 RepID=UPI002639EE25|nr:ABC transporter ATP-binding protein [uncultured Castellaniella sp.]